MCSFGIKVDQLFFTVCLILTKKMCYNFILSSSYLELQYDVGVKGFRLLFYTICLILVGVTVGYRCNWVLVIIYSILPVLFLLWVTVGYRCSRVRFTIFYTICLILTWSHSKTQLTISLLTLRLSIFAFFFSTNRQ